MPLSPPFLMSLPALAADSAAELGLRIGSHSSEMEKTRVLGQKLLAAGSAEFPDADARQVLAALAALTRSQDTMQVRNFACQMGQSLVQVAGEGWNVAQGLSELQKFSGELSEAAAPRRRIAAPVCGA